MKKKTRLRIDILSIFPNMFSGFLKESIIKRAQEAGLVEIEVHNLRDWTHDRHRSVDDRPFGGGPGMIMRPEAIFEAVAALKSRARKLRPKVILLCPQGETLTQKLAGRILGSRRQHLILICGHYEGVDERVRKKLAEREISIGDYVTTGGEVPAMVLIDALTRLIPGVLGDAASLRAESFVDGLLEYPQYTRPRNFRGMKVPEVLVSGDHQAIARWREEMSIRRTSQRRPELINKKAKRRKEQSGG